MVSWRRREVPRQRFGGRPCQAGGAKGKGPAAGLGLEHLRTSGSPEWLERRERWERGGGGGQRGNGTWGPEEKDLGIYSEHSGGTGRC